MFFTQDDYKKIHEWLAKNSIKDTEFNKAVAPFKGNEIIAFVQNGQNVKAYLSDFVAQLLLLGIPDFVNITDKYHESYITLSTAIRLIPFRSRKIGQVITFIDETGNWVIYQFQGKAVNQWNNETLWVNIIQKATGGAVADEEDLTEVTEGEKSVLKFKDKQYNPDEFSGLGRVYLRKNITNVDGVSMNLLTQNMLNKSNTIYIIQYDYDLNGQTIIVPENCVLKFEGGSIKNGILVGDNTKVNADLSLIFGENMQFQGSYNIPEVYPEWFGATGKDDSDDTLAIQSCVLFGRASSSPIILSKYYNISDTIKIYPTQSIIGKDFSQFYTNIGLNQKSNKDAIAFVTEDNSNITRITIKDIELACSYEGADKNCSGISVNNEGQQYSLSRCIFDNVFIQHFKYGIKTILYNYNGFAYNIFHRVYLTYNSFGLWIEGKVTSDSERNAWANLNSYDSCVISNNTCGGCVFYNLNSQEENTFRGCSFEANGTDYSLSDKELLGKAGFAFYGKGSSYGYCRFINCYIEGNYPRRSGTDFDSDYEYSFNNMIYPLDIDSNPVFYCYQSPIQVSNCKLSSFILLGHYDLPMIIFENNDYNITNINYREGEKIKYLHYFDMTSNSFTYSCVYINESQEKPSLYNRDSLFYTSPKYTSDNIVGMRCYIKSFLVEGVIDIHDKKVSGKRYFDSTSENRSFLGLTKCNPITNILSSIQWSNDNEEIELLSDWTLSGSIDFSRCDNITILGNSKSINLNGQRITFTDYLCIKNAIINIGDVEYGRHFSTNRKATLIFENCTIHFKNTNQYFILSQDDIDARFINCTFTVDTVSSNVTNNYLFLINPRDRTQHINFTGCTFPDNVIFPSENNIWYYYNNASNITKKVGDIIRLYRNSTTREITDICYWDGENIRNQDETLISKVIVI